MGNAVREEPANDQTLSPLERRLDRVASALERLVLVEERKLAGKSAAEKRALKQAGSTTDEAIAQVAKRLKKFRSKR